MKKTNESNILFSVNSPSDIKKLSLSQLPQLADELRRYIIDVVSETGGHLAPSLGTVELTVALLYVFDLPDDKIIWDVGHQAYPYKVLTGRRDKLNSIRQFGGISGFLKRSESEYDVVGAGHASTSISSALGISAAESLRKLNNHIIAVIGDGALTGGLAWEGMNNAGNLQHPLLVILNDNEMSISKNVGSIPNYLHKIVTTRFYNRLRDDIWGLTKNNSFLRRSLRNLKETLKLLTSRNVMFDELGLRYIGPINGHNIYDLVRTLKKVKRLDQPILLHVITKKGCGYREAEDNPIDFHGIAGNGTKKAVSDKSVAYMNIFGKCAVELAEKHKDVAAITAAMTNGTGLCEYKDKFKNRFYDVGIAEGHAVTFASGLAIGGMRPIVAVYSSFMQRAVDNVMHDVVLQKLPVIFCMDRAGLVGKDGPTHHGVYDFAFISMMPDVIVCAPKDGNELRQLMHMAYDIKNKPVFIRYPRGKTKHFDMNLEIDPPVPGSWELLETGDDITVLAIGSMVETAIETSNILTERGIRVSVINARFLKPYDKKMLTDVIDSSRFIFTIEEACPGGGLGSTVLKVINQQKNKVSFESMSLPDDFVTHGTRQELLQTVGLTPEKIAEKIETAVKRRSDF